MCYIRIMEYYAAITMKETTIQSRKCYNIELREEYTKEYV